MKTLQKNARMTTAQTTLRNGGKASVVALAILLAGCSTVGNLLQGEKIDYKTSGKSAPSLDIPPDLTQLSRETRYVVPGAAVTASSM